MRFFRPIGADGYELARPVVPPDYEQFLDLRGDAIGLAWQPPLVEIVQQDGRTKLARSDFPWLGLSILLLRQEARAALADLLAASGVETLPVDTTGGDGLFVLNPPTVDALDRDRAQVRYFPGTDRIMRIEVAALIPSRVSERLVFRLPMRAPSTFVSERFVDRVASSNLRGVRFEEVRA